jgi:hypothetical protein
MHASFSFLKDNVSFVQIDNKLQLRIERINDNIARIFLVDHLGVQQPFTNRIRVTNMVGHVQAPFLNNILITWVDSYTVSVDGEVFMCLNNPKQLFISAPSEGPSGILE